MANFLVIVDPDPARRHAFMRQAEPRLAVVDGLQVSRLDLGNFSARWAASPRAPTSQHGDSDSAAMVWGHALEPEGPITAQRVAIRWAGSASSPPPAFDGYFAAAAFRREGGLVVGADLLGLFPVYYAAFNDVCIASATPEPFRFHPLFPAAVDREGLVGLLIVRAPLGGRTLLRGVSRLSAAHALVWTPGDLPKEVPQYRIPETRPDDRSAFSDHVAALDDALAAAVKQHPAPAVPCGILLSGGRDSRMWAGYLAEQNSPLHALTLGERGDFEVECAAPVAAALGTMHDIASVADTEYPGAADIQANQEHLIGGFSNVFMWGLVEPLRRLPPNVVTGYLTDSILTGKSVTPGLHDFDIVLPRLVHLALAPEQLARLLRPDVFGSAIEETVERLRAAWNNTAPPEQQRAWRFQIAHSERCHVGAIPWRLSFGSWPVLPVLDRRVLDTVGALPAPSLANRRAQDAILRARFPRLARLPHVAANGDVVDPLLPSLGTRVARIADRLTRGVRRQTTARAHAGERDRRFNYRMYDFNSPGWRAIRRRAEPARERLAGLFDMDELRAFLPPPDATLDLSHPIFDSVGRKLVVGFMLWAREHLP
jgi:asparagine synthase (glutamine-hydrolysing)